jgi:hypothetical protein
VGDVGITPAARVDAGEEVDVDEDTEDEEVEDNTADEAGTGVVCGAAAGGCSSGGVKTVVATAGTAFVVMGLASCVCVGMAVAGAVADELVAIAGDVPVFVSARGLFADEVAMTGKGATTGDAVGVTAAIIGVVGRI